MLPSQPAFFVPDGDRFVSTESTRGPWSRDYQHGGPPAALLTRALERAAGDGVLLTRVVFDVARPVPIATLAVSAEVVRAGARVRQLQATVAEAHGIGLTRARLWDHRGAFGVSLQSCLAEKRPT